MALSEEIKGISIKIGADVTTLNNALKSVDASVKGTGQSLKEINKLLKFDPSSTDLLKQKQSALKDQIADTKTKLDALKQAQKEAKDMFASGEIDKGAYQKLSREVTATEQSLKKYKGELSDTNRALITHGDTMQQVGDKLKTVGGAMAKVGEAAAAVTAVVGAAAIAIGKEVVQNYAEYEQLIGGVETLFGDSAGKVEEYANNAFKTTGLSANEYMETVTSFSASLLQSLDGDTEAAADKADQALRDMSDNANKMGTDMESIQNAYQGFAKQNYTMLDNLKLGYGGTKSEMERLLADAEKISGIKYDISSYSDVIDAIHVMQTEMGITGTTALEAEKTVSGSLNSLKASYQNLITGLADPDADVSQLVGNVVTSFENLANNVMPIIQNLVAALPTAFAALSEAATTLLPTLISTATGLLAQLVTAIINALPTLIPVAVQSVQTIVDTLIANLPLLVSAAIQITIALAGGLIQAIPDLIAAIPEIIKAIVDTFASYDWASIGHNLMEGIKNGILNAWENIKSAITNVANKIKSKFEDIFDINSPSRWAEERIGKNLDLGLAQGIDKYKTLATNAAKSVSGAVQGAFANGVSYDYGSVRGSALTINTPVYLDGKVIANVVNNRLGVML